MGKVVVVELHSGEYGESRPSVMSTSTGTQQACDVGVRDSLNNLTEPYTGVEVAMTKVVMGSRKVTRVTRTELSTKLEL